MLSSAGRGSFLALLTAGRAGALPVRYGKAHVRARAELGGACSGHPKSHALALVQGISFRATKPRRPMETPQFHIFAFLLLLSHTVAPLSLAGRWKPHKSSFSLFLLLLLLYHTVPSQALEFSTSTLWQAR